MINNKINDKNEYKENKYNELINEENNNKKDIAFQINDLKLKEQNNMQCLENKLNEFKNKQIEINNQNKQIIDHLNRKINEQINELGNIKKNINNNDNNPIIDKKIDDLEKKIKQLEEFAGKIDILMNNNKEEAYKKFEQINMWFQNSKKKISTKINELKNYLDENYENLQKSRFSNINMKGENKFNNKSSINYNDKTD